MSFKTSVFRCASSTWVKQSLSHVKHPNYGLFSTSAVHNEKDYAFEMACSSVRYGEGCTQEVGLDCKNFGAKHVCVMTDKKLAGMSPVQVVLESLDRHNVPYKLYDRVRCEPSDQSFKEAIDYAKEGNFDVYLAVGGGSVIDTCKAANLYASNPSAELLDYVNAPIGKGLPITHTLKPLIAVTTTAGTGSETTGTAVFDFLEMRAKTGISNRALRPTLGIVDPLHLRTMPERVAAYSGIDVLCHALESFTAMPFSERMPRPENPNMRPAYQGSNPVSDIWSKHALRMTAKYLKRAVYQPEDWTARRGMHFAASYAGIGFGNAGTHLCHGMCYPISGLNRKYFSRDYNDDHPLIPHGLSVVITAPAVFMFTSKACPERHLEAAECLGVDVRNVRKEDAGMVLSETVRKIMDDIEVPNGLKDLGYSTEDIPDLVKGTLPQHRVTKLCPRPFDGDDIAELLEKSMRVY
ncbi:hydroxyacid-oxoacid transhydrogenase, mitochondrial-like [Gigantopelta aegis]|uniref:hydroxyacid-oxoacid transhydrogenase, mitochondrial-like n=1 Tax=Gigantopelta aegis TaxID=1735272 RepID=UPI001B88B40A|nr:hydroxyacid-oxoacid transhydrogenase, mitochondrial-like [Gigantopelta aegis]